MFDIPQTLALQLLVALGIGLLIGMEREQSDSAGHFAGSRTFPMIALFGALVQGFFPHLLGIAFVVLALPIAVAYFTKIMFREDAGMTTTLAALLTFVFGAMSTHSQEGMKYAVILGTLTTVLLAMKESVHTLVSRIDHRERQAMLKFLVLALVIFPLLPNEKLEILWDLNPQFVWIMVLFVSGISLLAYVLTRFIGARKGMGLTGFLGGLVSSTATTISMAERSRENADLSAIAGLSAALASLVMFPRALVEVAVVNPYLLWYVSIPLGVMLFVGLLLTGILFWRVDSGKVIEARLENPFQLKEALFFGIFFALILVIIGRASHWFGHRGVYATAFLSALADVDAVTISLSKHALDGKVDNTVATMGIVIATISNTLVKVGIAAIVGTARLAKIVALILGITALAGIGTLLAMEGIFPWRQIW